MNPNSSEIEKTVIRIADSVRGVIPLQEIFTLTLRLVFLRYVELQFDIVSKQMRDEGVKGEIDKEACKSTKTIFVPPLARFSRLLKIHQLERIGHEIERSVEILESENEFLWGRFPQQRKRIEDMFLFDLLKAIAGIHVSVDGKELAEVFEAILQNLIRSSGKTECEYATPVELAGLLVEIVKPQPGMKVYDPCVGMGGTLLNAARFVEEVEQFASGPLLYGQDQNPDVLAICTMRMIVNGIKAVDLRLGNTLTDPRHLIDGGRLATFDRVISSPPFTQWQHRIDEHDSFNRYVYGVPPRKSADFAYIQHMLGSAAANGMIAVLVSHGVLFRGGSEGRIRQRIVEADLVQGVVGLPAGLFFGTDVSSAVLVFNKNKSHSCKGKVIFIDACRDFIKQDRHKSLRQDDVARIVTTFESFSNVERYARVVQVDEIQKQGFNLYVPRYADSSPISALITQYSQYEKFTLKELATDINSVSRKGAFEEKENSVYIPINGGKRSTESLSQIEGNHSSYYQVVLSDRTICGYVALFFRSSVGLHALSILAQGSTIKRINKPDLYECMIAVPSLDIQNQIISTHGKLTALKDAIANLDQELSLNPTLQSDFTTQVDSMLKVIGKLSDADQIRNLIRQGESKTVEFKETFSLNLRHDSEKKDPVMEDMCLKTIVAFLNSDGGHLLVGVADDGKVSGIDSEIAKFHKSSTDKFLLNFKNIVKNRIGVEFYPFFTYSLVEVDGKKLMIVECEPSQKPCFLDAEVFYVRTNPATDMLVGPKQAEYIKHRFWK